MERLDRDSVQWQFQDNNWQEIHLFVSTTFMT